MSATDVLTPATLDDLVAALSRATPRTRLLAGGSRAPGRCRRPGHAPDLLVDLTGLRDLCGVRLDGDTLRVGALTTFTDLQRDPLVRQHALCLALAAAHVGSVQIRNAGTVGGNIANASPCADSATALTALAAEVTTVDGSGSLLTRPIGEVLLGPNRTSLRHDQAIVEFSFRALGPEYRTAFTKIGSRTAVSVARLSAALVVRFDAVFGTLADVRLALGAVGGTAFRATEVEALLEGRPADEDSAHILADGCVAVISGSIPDRPSLPYKRHAATGLAYDSWNALALCPPCEPDWS